MKNWKTTIGAVLVAFGTGLQQISDPDWVKHIGTLFIGAGSALIGFFAKDYDTTGTGDNARKY